MGLISCQNVKEPDFTLIHVLVDVTDPQLNRPEFASENLEGLLELMQLDKNTGGYSGGEIKLSYINDVSDSKSKTIRLKKGKPGLMGENPLTRKDEVDKFINSLEKELTSFVASAEWGKPSSKIYQKVTRECIKMKRANADKKILIIFSDLLENSNLFSFYSNNWKEEITGMTQNIEQTAETLSGKVQALPDLSEFVIYIVANRNAQTDEKINVSEAFWTALFEFWGAKVYINAELQIQ